MARFVLIAFRVDAAGVGADAEVEPLVEEQSRLSPYLSPLIDNPATAADAGRIASLAG